MSGGPRYGSQPNALAKLMGARGPIRGLIVLIVLLGAVCVATPARADGPMGRTFGVGVALGNPLSLTAKYHLGANEAIDFHIGAFRSYYTRNDGFWRNSLFLAADYVFEIWNFHQDATLSVPFYAGPGLGVAFSTGEHAYCFDGRGRRYSCGMYNFGFGPRLPVGVAVEFQKAPFELALEMAPTLMIYTRDSYYGDGIGTRFDILNFAFIARFYF